MRQTSEEGLERKKGDWHLWKDFMAKNKLQMDKKVKNETSAGLEIQFMSKRRDWSYLHFDHGSSGATVLSDQNRIENIL